MPSPDTTDLKMATPPPPISQTGPMAAAVAEAEAESETKSTAEALIPEFRLTRLLNQDQQGRRISLQGSIQEKPALLTIERAAFPTSSDSLAALLAGIAQPTNLGANDVYRWYMAHSRALAGGVGDQDQGQAARIEGEGGRELMDRERSRREGEVSPSPDLKLNLIYPCTPRHVRKYTPQRLRTVTETPAIYRTYIRPFMAVQRSGGRLTWVENILAGITESEDVVGREEGVEGFLLLPDLNWDRKEVGGLHLLALVMRRDLWSLRDLRKGDVGWLKGLRERVVKRVGEVYGVEGDEVKCYLHYQPTYYHLHVHIVHVSLEAGATQATGKAFGLENLISQLETIQGDDNSGMADVDLTYTMGEASELWEGVFALLKRGETPRFKNPE